MTPSDLLARLATFAFADTPRNRLYAKLVDQGTEQLLSAPLEVEFSSPLTRRRFACALTARLAYSFASPWSRYQGNPSLLLQARERLLAFAANQSADGGLTSQGTLFGAQQVDEPGDPANHENSWNLEALILAALWLRPFLSAEENQTVRMMVERAARSHAALPIPQSNNREVCRCAVLALSGVFLEEPELIAQAKSDFGKHALRVFEKGNLLEGPSPDGNYSSVSALYGWLYLRFSDDERLAQELPGINRWMAWNLDDDGFATCFGSSSRWGITRASRLARYLPLLEIGASEDPHLAWMIDQRYLRNWKPLPEGLKATETLWYAMLEQHDAPACEDPEWFLRARRPRYLAAAGPEYSNFDEGCDYYHFIVREAYNTTINVMGRLPYKGLQNWNLNGEPPVLWPSAQAASQTVARGIDTAALNVSGAKGRDKIWREGPPATLVMRFESAWQLYLFTPVSTVLVTLAPPEGREDLWVSAHFRCGKPTFESGALLYAGRRGRMIVPTSAHYELEHFEGYSRLRGALGEKVSFTAWSDERFAWLSTGENEGAFRDGSGAYSFCFTPPEADLLNKLDRSYAAKISPRFQWKATQEHTKS